MAPQQVTDRLSDQLRRRMTRRGFLRGLGGMILGAAAAGLGGITYVTRIEPGWVDVVQVELTLPRLHPAFDGFRLAQLSDIHTSQVLTGKEVTEAVQAILRLEPNLVAITGDFVDERKGLAGYLAELTGALKPLAEQVQTVAVLGNHDYRMGAAAIRQFLKGVGIQELNNSLVSLTRGAESLHIAGVDDPWKGRARLGQVTGQLPDDGAAVLLAHEPDFADQAAQTRRFDLQLSGHTHGGQVVPPFGAPPILPYMGRKYPSGLYQVGQMLQYTNRGLGTTEPHLRFNCRPEITLFILKSGSGI